MTAEVPQAVESFFEKKADFLYIFATFGRFIASKVQKQKTERYEKFDCDIDGGFGGLHACTCTEVSLWTGK